MTTAITGAAIGFLVWAGLAVAELCLTTGLRLQWRRMLISGVAFTGSGAAIDWLIGGGA